MEIKHIQERKVLLALNDEIQIGELQYQIADGVMVISYTEVEPHYRGNNIAESLVLKALGLAKEQNLKVDPQCSYAVEIFKRYPSHKDLLVR